MRIYALIIFDKMKPIEETWCCSDSISSGCNSSHWIFVAFEKRRSLTPINGGIIIGMQGMIHKYWYVYSIKKKQFFFKLTFSHSYFFKKKKICILICILFLLLFSPKITNFEIFYSQTTNSQYFASYMRNLHKIESRIGRRK